MILLRAAQVAMAAAAGIVVAQDYAAPDSDNRTVKERLNVLQEVRRQHKT